MSWRQTPRWRRWGSGACRARHGTLTARAARGSGAAVSLPVVLLLTLLLATIPEPRVTVLSVCVLQEVDEEVQKNHFLVN